MLTYYKFAIITDFSSVIQMFRSGSKRLISLGSVLIHYYCISDSTISIREWIMIASLLWFWLASHDLFLKQLFACSSEVLHIRFQDGLWHASFGMYALRGLYFSTCCWWICLTTLSCFHVLYVVLSSKEPYAIYLMYYANLRSLSVSVSELNVY
jgi:hypothetical protein